MAACTAFCENLKALNSHSGSLPTHQTLASELRLGESGCYLGTFKELQQHQSCQFCQLVVAAITSATAEEDVPPDQQINLLVFPHETSFRLSYPCPLGLQLAFVTDVEASALDRQSARIVHDGPVPLSRLKSWLKTCDANHELCFPKPVDESKLQFKRGNFSESATSNFRVLDLDKGCVMPAPLHTRYFTLSYVWGQSPMFRLKAANFSHLTEPGNLDSIRAELPQTINDAIDLVRALGERYLWIDGLCLVQDDESDVSLGVRMMNSIYSGSYCTIVAGSGTDASAGLPGIGKTERDLRNERKVYDVARDLKMTIMYSIDWHLSHSVYNTRGWTLQELVLPRRTMIFIDSQVYFRCQEANWSEDSWADEEVQTRDPDDSNLLRIPEAVEGFMPSFWAYQKMSEEYSRRHLRRDGDAVRALAGITRQVAAGMETFVLEGLPGYYLDHFLLFISANGNMRRRPDFASYSWAGWEGRIMYPRENFMWPNEAGELKWDRSHIVKYLRYTQIVAWNALGMGGSAENLTSHPYEESSLISQVMNEYPQVFADTETDPLRQRLGHWWESGSGSCSDVPHWKPYPDDDSWSFLGERKTLEERKLRPIEGFSIKALDLANGQAEYERLLGIMQDKWSLLAMYNWIAVRGGRQSTPIDDLRVRDAIEDRSAIGPRLGRRYSDGEEEAHFQYRTHRTSALDESLTDGKTNDHRIKNGRRWKKLSAEKGEESPPIPRFPPYHVLSFVTISFHLQLGATGRTETQGPSLFERVPGIPLLSSTSEVVGSLHPDNFQLLEREGSNVELIIVSRSVAPTVGSALPEVDKVDSAKPFSLFWVLHVAWKDGIAERRGVGQVLASALESATEPKPEVKLVLLG